MNTREAVLANCAQRFRIYAQTTKDGGLEKTSRRLLELADKIQSDDFLDVAKDYQSFLTEFKQEVTGGDSKQGSIYEALKQILEPAGRGINLQQLDSIVQLTKAAQQAVGQTMKSFQSTGLTNEQRFYGLCFVYLLMVEGVYDQVMRYLLAWTKWPLNIDKVTDKIDRIQTELLQMGNYQVLFDNYKRRVRNSIAHARFSFDIGTSMAAFDDVNEKDPNDKFHCDMPYTDFVGMVVGLYEVLFLYQMVLLMTVYVPVTLLEAKNAQ
jgi:hypothetical protein